MSNQLENNTTGLEELLSIANELQGAPVKSVNGKTGVVVLTPADIGAIETETDPTVPSWAKASSKPSYTASEISTGTFAGAITAQRSSQTYSSYLLRNSRLSTSATNPSYNGEICWIYG